MLVARVLSGFNFSMKPLIVCILLVCVCFGSRNSEEVAVRRPLWMANESEYVEDVEDSEGEEYPEEGPYSLPPADPVALMNEGLFREAIAALPADAPLPLIITIYTASIRSDRSDFLKLECTRARTDSDTTQETVHSVCDKVEAGIAQRAVSRNAQQLIQILRSEIESQQSEVVSDHQLGEWHLLIGDLNRYILDVSDEGWRDADRFRELARSHYTQAAQLAKPFEKPHKLQLLPFQIANNFGILLHRHCFATKAAIQMANVAIDKLDVLRARGVGFSEEISLMERHLRRNRETWRANPHHDEWVFV